jgi:PqqD family protein of HPr-rel-A system
VCVQAWLSSGRDFHLIRDHCYHSQPIMGGMWGVRGGVLPQIGEWISEYEANGGTYDQGFLAERIYPLTVGRALVHTGDQRDGAGAPTDYFRDGAVPIPACDEVDEAVAGISWLEAHRLNAFTCSHCGQVHPTYIGPIFEAIPAAALEVVEKLGVATGDEAAGEGAMTVSPACVPGIEINEVKDGLVVYDPRRGRVHYLNHTAALILSLCTGRNAEADIIRLVKDAFSLDAHPTSEVSDCLAQLRNEGLIS